MPLSIRFPVALVLFALLTGPAASTVADDAKVCTSYKSTPDDTIRSCSRLLRQKLTSAQKVVVLTWRIAAYQIKGDSDAALKDADDIIRETPVSHTGFELRTQVWLAKGDLERAKRDVEEAIRLAPKVAGPYNARGTILSMTGQFDEAIADFDRAIQLDPKQVGFFNNRGSAWQNKGDFQRALLDQNAAIKLKADDIAFVSRGDLYRTMGDLDRAIADYDQATKLSPKFALAFGGRGLVWRARGDFDRAITEFEGAIARDPQYIAAYAGRGLAHESKGDIEAAKRDFRLAVAQPATAAIKGTSLGAFHGSNLRYKAMAQSRLQVLEATGAARPEPAPARAPLAPSSIKERRIALVIGNGAYTGASKLANPANDAASIAKALRDIGFEVSEGLNLDTQKMKDTINGFLRGASTASMAVMFYAGHGMQIDGRNFLVPIDAKFDNAANVASDMSDVDTILAGLDDQLRTNIVILDACRDNPTVPQTQTTIASRSVQVRSGLAAQSGLGAGATIGAGTLVAFATAPGQVALDGEGANSPFSAALARHISTPGLEVQQMLTRVRAEVVAATKNKQVPWSNSSLLGEVFLVGSR